MLAGNSPDGMYSPIRADFDYNCCWPGVLQLRQLFLDLEEFKCVYLRR